jgi:hypothetical protein
VPFSVFLPPLSPYNLFFQIRVKLMLTQCCPQSSLKHVCVHHHQISPRAARAAWWKAPIGRFRGGTGRDSDCRWGTKGEGSPWIFNERLGGPHSFLYEPVAKMFILVIARNNKNVPKIAHIRYLDPFGLFS